MLEVGVLEMQCCRPLPPPVANRVEEHCRLDLPGLFCAEVNEIAQTGGFWSATLPQCIFPATKRRPTLGFGCWGIFDPSSVIPYCAKVGAHGFRHTTVWPTAAARPFVSERFV